MKKSIFIKRIGPEKTGFYYKKEDLVKMSPEDMIKFMFQETNYQETLNMIRIVVKERKEKEKNIAV